MTNSQQIGMQWNPPDAGTNQCSPILEYKLFKNENRGITWDVEASGLSSTNYLFADAETCVNYGFGVRARNEKCWGTMSKLADLVAAERPNKPNRPSCELDPVTGMFYFEWIYDQGETCNPVS